MKIRARILLAFVLLAVVPMILVMLVVRQNVAQRFNELDTRRAEDQINIARQDLDQQSRQLIILLDALAEAIDADNRFRLALSGVRPDLRGYLVDYAPRSMSLMDLDLLLIQDRAGTVLSSGHFRGSFGLAEPDLPRLLGHVNSGQALLAARSPEGSFLALARTRQLEMAGQVLHLTAGIKLDADNLRNLGRDDDLQVALAWSDGFLSSSSKLQDRLETVDRPEELEILLRQDGAIVRSAEIPLLTENEPRSALLLVVHDQGFLKQLLNQLNLRLALILAAAMAASIFLAVVFSNHLSLPLRQLAAQTQDLDLDNLEVEFQSRRSDEVGNLTRLLGQMTARLRDSVGRLRSAEHRATLGEVARQVNHDVRNGLTPLRNVIQHLGQVAEEEPAQLPEIFSQRKQTLEDGLGYLEDLATHYARLSPARNEQPCKLSDIIDEALASPQVGPEVAIQNQVGTSLPPVMADPISLRRIFDNLIRNALESLPDEGGILGVNGFLEEDPHFEEMRIIIEVTDTGVGIPEENLDRIFNDFFTTRDQGTGLGLSNVRRLAADCGAHVRVASQVGHGTTFTLSFPLMGPS